RLPARENDLDRLAGGDCILGDLHRTDVLITPEARVDPLRNRRLRVRHRSARTVGLLGRTGAPGALERLEDRALGDAVAALEIGRGRVQRCDRREVVREMVE